MLFHEKAKSTLELIWNITNGSDLAGWKITVRSDEGLIFFLPHFFILSSLGPWPRTIKHVDRYGATASNLRSRDSPFRQSVGPNSTIRDSPWNVLAKVKLLANDTSNHAVRDRVCGIRLQLPRHLPTTVVGSIVISGTLFFRSWPTTVRYHWIRYRDPEKKRTWNGFLLEKTSFQLLRKQTG